MRRVLILLFVLLVSSATVWPAAHAGTEPPDRIALPDGFQPEGIAIVGSRFYVGSIPTGAVYRGSLATGRGAILVPGRSGRSAIGIEVARGLVFVAGGETGKAFVYDARTGGDVSELELTSGMTFINDVVVTRQAAWFTDSLNPVLYRVALGPSGRPGTQAEVRSVPLSGAIRYQEGFNVNGIDATPNGARLVIVQSNTGRLFTVDPATGRTRAVDLGDGSVANGDGILLAGRRLYVVQNQQNAIAVLRLARDLGSGTIARRITDPDFDVPTTIGRRGPWLYAVNARFGTDPTPQTQYWITRVRR
jgi:sugar lactone lactonase YvrE